VVLSLAMIAGARHIYGLPIALVREGNMSKTIHLFENPLDNKQIEFLNGMFGNVSDYENNMLQLWRLRSLLNAQLEMQKIKNPELLACFHTLNNLIGSLLPTHGTYHPVCGLSIWKDNNRKPK
jgi:hypothetical protein